MTHLSHETHITHRQDP